MNPTTRLVMLLTMSLLAMTLTGCPESLPRDDGLPLREIEPPPPDTAAPTPWYVDDIEINEYVAPAEVVDEVIPDDTLEDSGTEEVDEPQCWVHADCAEVFHDLGPCEDAKCDKEIGRCFVKPRIPCCTDDAQCSTDAPNECLSALCTYVGGTCERIDTCAGCATDDHCDDGDGCTIDTCIGDFCYHVDKQSCCHGDEDCAVDDECLEGSCQDDQCVIRLLDLPACGQAPFIN